MKAKWLSCLVFSALLMTGCTPSLEEVNRVRSPDGLFDAATFIRQTDATVAMPTEIYVVPAGGTPSGDPIWRADKVSGMKISWMLANSLRVEAAEARVFLSRDLVEVAPIGSADKRKVTVVYHIEREP